MPSGQEIGGKIFIPVGRQGKTLSREQGRGGKIFTALNKKRKIENLFSLTDSLTKSNLFVRLLVRDIY